MATALKLLCMDCSSEFDFTAGEQRRFDELGFNPPIRCGPCRAKKRGDASRPERPMFTTSCSTCGDEARVPFEPVKGRPVYCRDCWDVKNGASSCNS